MTFRARSPTFHFVWEDEYGFKNNGIRGLGIQVPHPSGYVVRLPYAFKTNPHLTTQFCCLYIPQNSVRIHLVTYIKKLRNGTCRAACSAGACNPDFKKRAQFETGHTLYGIDYSG